MSRSIRLWLVFMAVTFALPASAITIDFTEILLVNQPHPLVLGPVTFTSETGELLVLRTSGGNGLAGANGAAADLYVAFDLPVTSVTLTMGDGGDDVDLFRVSAFDFTTGSLITVVDSAPDPALASVTITAANIGALILDPGNFGSLPGVFPGSGGVVLYSMDYTPVPEPSTALLLGVGLLLLTGGGRPS